MIEHAFALAGRPARASSATSAPRAATTRGTSRRSTQAFLGRDVRRPHLSLFPMPNVEDVRAHLLAQDVVWVGGGSVANLLALWRLHGLDGVFREAWEAGVVLGGVSAGSICWHVGGTTDSFGPELRAVTERAGLLPYSNGVHYDTEERRRPLLHRLVADGTLPAGYAADDGVGLHYRGTELVAGGQRPAGREAPTTSSRGRRRRRSRSRSSPAAGSA